mgnify:CR=1 FL=1
MSAQTNMQDMKFFEDYVNSVLPCNRPSFVGEPLRIVLPQKFNPVMMSKKDRKSMRREFEVRVIFVAERFCGHGRDWLEWRYHDLEIVELI